MSHGLLLVDKGTGLTSHDVVQRVRRLLRDALPASAGGRGKGKQKVGHCGTLDPNATGLLLLTVGNATRLTRFLIRAPKVYEGTIRLGTATDTYDAAGEVTGEHPVEGIDRARIEEAMSRFEGTIEHAAPPYSAKKVQGKKLYELARQGEEVPRETKEVTVYEFVPLWDESGFREEGGGEDRNDVRFRLGCASGTYARTLAHDLGRELGCGAHLAALRRTRIGPFELSSALALEELGERLETAGAGAVEAPLDALGDAWVPFDEIPLPFVEITADHQQEERVRHGQTVLVRELSGEEGDWIKLMNRREQLIAVGTVSETIGERGVGIVQPRVVFK